MNTDDSQKTNTKAPATPPKPTFNKVDVVIAGKTYSINCPTDEEHELQRAATYIHNFIRDLRQEAPKLSHEDLLVLCCLNLYAKIHQQEKTERAQRMEQQRIQALIEKIAKDARSILH